MRGGEGVVAGSDGDGPVAAGPSIPPTGRRFCGTCAAADPSPAWNRKMLFVLATAS